MPFALWSELAARTTEMLVASAQVIGHRTGRMAGAGATPSLRDRREFSKMGMEKAEAIGESAFAVGKQLSKTNVELGMRAWRDMCNAGADWMSLAGSRTIPQALARQAKLMHTVSQSMQSASQLSHVTARVTERALMPIHSRATANAKRLGRTR